MAQLYMEDQNLLKTNTLAQIIKAKRLSMSLGKIKAQLPMNPLKMPSRPTAAPKQPHNQTAHFPKLGRILKANYSS